MALTNGKLLRTYAAEDPRLGRHLELDSRSQPYFIEKLLAQPVAIKPAEWLPAIPTLDQGHLHEQGLTDEPGNPEALGSCTGNAGTYGLSSLLGTAGLQNAQLNGLGLTNYSSAPNERFAIELYSRASRADGFGGTGWPSDDRGSSGLGVCKALKAAGLIGSYVWATTVEGIGVLLQNGGILIGMPWFNAFFEPDAQGFIDSGNWQASGVAGGHELYFRSLVVWDDRDPFKSVVEFDQSWGKPWGDHGVGRMRLSTYVAQASEIDAKQIILKAA